MPDLYETYTAADFVLDDAFLKHQLAPSAQSTQFWDDWLRRHPHRETEWQTAGRLLEAVRLGLNQYARAYLSAELETQLLDRIQATNAFLESQNRVVPLRRSVWWNRAAAASVVLGLGVGLWFWVNRDARQSPYQRQIASLAQPPVQQTNSTRVIKPVHLPDGSLALLYPQSHISYPRDFGRTNRTVFLLGKATFDVVKNPARPFFVYANELVTRVLGTRFTVEAFEQDRQVVVRVQHGQVNVYPNASLRSEMDSPRTLKGILILPNQQVVFSRQNEQFTKEIVAEPTVIESMKGGTADFQFYETPVAEAFERIKKVYGIPVNYNADDLRHCQLTATLTEESLFQKLDVITQSIGATYQMVDGEIVITAKGCTPQ